MMMEGVGVLGRLWLIGNFLVVIVALVSRSSVDKEKAVTRVDYRFW